MVRYSKPEKKWPENRNFSKNRFLPGFFGGKQGVFTPLPVLRDRESPLAIHFRLYEPEDTKRRHQRTGNTQHNIWAYPAKHFPPLSKHVKIMQISCSWIPVLEAKDPKISPVFLK
jgi:hypothetical protein